MTSSAILKSPLPYKAWVALSLLLAAGLLAAALLGPPKFSYDEIPYLIQAMDEYLAAPDKTDYLSRGWTVPPGPVHLFIYYGLLPVTGNTPLASRVVNYIMVLGTVALLAALLRAEGHTRGRAWFASFSLLAIPPAWLIAALAITEIPALLFLMAALLLVHRETAPRTGLGEVSAGKNRLPLLLLAGVSFGVSIVGRQPYLLVLPMLALLMLWWRAPLGLVTAFVIASLVLPIFMFSVWGGLVAPMAKYSNSGIRWQHGVMSVCYLGMCLVFLCPWWLLRVPWRLLAGVSAGALILNSLVLGVKRAFLETLALRYLPVTREAWEIVGGSVCVAMAAVTLACLAYHCWMARDQPLYLFSAASALALAGTAAAISHNFSSRYPTMAVPFLIIMSMRHREWGALEALSTVAGAGLGAMVLWSYHITSLAG